MSVACSVELCAESMAPSSTCAQLALTSILTILTFVVGDGAHAGRSNGGAASAPIQTQTKPPVSSDR
jgi:hypothetical protein